MILISATRRNVDAFNVAAQAAAERGDLKEAKRLARYARRLERGLDEKHQLAAETHQLEEPRP